MDRFAPVQHPRSRHLDTPSHKNSLAVSENNPSEHLMNKSLCKVANCATIPPYE